MAFGVVTILHAVLAVFLIIELGLMAYLVDWFYDSPSSYNFELFNVVWSILVLIYLVLATTFLTRIHHGLAVLGLLLVTTIFWFAGSTAMAAWLGVPNCHNTACHSSQAAIAFGYFIWAIFTGLTVLEGLAFHRGRGTSAHTEPKPGHSYP